MQLSRGMRRSIKNSGVSKKLVDTFYKTISEIKKDIEPIDCLRLENDGKLYDITPLLLLSLSTLGVRCTDKGYDLVHKHICENIVDRDYADEKTKIYLVGANLCNILDKYDECGFVEDIARSLSIACDLGIYKGNIGECFVEDYYSDVVTNIYSIAEEPNRASDVYLSTLYGVTLDIFSLCMLDSKSITDEFLGFYLVVSTLTDDSDIFKFFKLCMSYCIKGRLKEDAKLKFSTELSGNILNDIANINESYVDIFKSLEYDVEKHEYINDCRSLTSEELNAMRLYRVGRVSTTLDFVYKFFIVEHCKKLNAFKKGDELKQKQLSKENKLLNKKLTKAESTLNKKVKEIDKLNKELRQSKKSNDTDEYKKRIAELEAKLKNTVSKNVALNNRIATLESRLKNISTAVSVSKVEEEVVIEEPVLEEVPSISMEEKLESISDNKLLVVGGNPSWFNRLKSKLPNSVHIDVNQKGCNYNVPLSTECVLIVSNVVTHSHVSRLETQLRKGVPVVYTPTYRLSDIVDYLYRDLVEKAIGTN